MFQLTQRWVTIGYRKLATRVPCAGSVLYGRKLMKQVLVMPLEDGGAIQIEVDAEPTGDPELVSVEGRAVKRLERKFDDALDAVKGCAAALVKKLGQLAVKPEQVCVEFGLKLSIEGDLKVVSAGADANFRIQLAWKPQR